METQSRKLAQYFAVQPSLGSAASTKSLPKLYTGGSTRIADSGYHFTPGPGAYDSSTPPFDPKVFSQLSHAGYYAVLESGKLRNKKQLFFATTPRAPAVPKDDSPGPGFYQSPTSVRKSGGKGWTTERKEAKDKKEPDRLGPGSYDVNSRPRIKGVAQWEKSKVERSEYLDRLFKKGDGEEGNPGETLPKEAVAKGNSQFVSKTTRFPHSLRAKEKNHQEDLLPGPGHYLDPSQLNTLIRRNVCIFPKGERFRSVPPEHCADRVGPGAYECCCPNADFGKEKPGAFVPTAKKEMNFGLPTEAPGPGNYADSDGMFESVEKKLKGKRESLGGYKDWDKREEEEEETPGPGTYSVGNKKWGGRKARASNAVFKSTTGRGELLVAEALVEAPRMDAYNSERQKALGQEPRLKNGGGNHFFKFIKVSPTKRPIFQSLTPRFIPASNKKLDNPGPGRYNPKDFSSDAKSPYLSRDVQRGPLSAENFDPGPGSYLSQGGRWEKPSFNIRYLELKQKMASD